MPSTKATSYQLTELCLHDELWAFGKQAKRWLVSRYPELKMEWSISTGNVKMEWSGELADEQAHMLVVHASAIQYVVPKA